MKEDVVVVAITSLEEVLCYKNDDVVHRFAEDFNLSLADSEAIFIELKKWLWLCALQGLSNSKSKHPTHPLTLFQEMFVVDLMWHTFILFTHDYSDFCENYFGTFVHHVPRSNRVKALPIKVQRDLIKNTYEYIYDNLGSETLLNWCEVLPLKFAKMSISV
jgi:hypothetical protein